MPTLVPNVVTIPVPGGKLIEEHIGVPSSGTSAVSIAHMHAPAGWTEPFQTPEFTEYTVVLRGLVTVECEGVVHECHAGQAIVTQPGERIRYGVGPQGAEYFAICLPAFAPDLVHRED
ncbi:MAG: cupin domain-containing protein [Candidatus Nanopelagicales bacterium]